MVSLWTGSRKLPIYILLLCEFIGEVLCTVGLFGAILPKQPRTKVAVPFHIYTSYTCMFSWVHRKRKYISYPSLFVLQFRYSYFFILLVASSVLDQIHYIDNLSSWSKYSTPACLTLPLSTWTWTSIRHMMTACQIKGLSYLGTVCLVFYLLKNDVIFTFISDKSAQYWPPQS